MDQNHKYYITISHQKATRSCTCQYRKCMSDIPKGRIPMTKTFISEHWVHNVQQIMCRKTITNIQHHKSQSYYVRIHQTNDSMTKY